MKNVKTSELRKTAQIKSLSEINKEVMLKRNEDLLRFRTCCADVRASK